MAAFSGCCFQPQIVANFIGRKSAGNHRPLSFRSASRLLSLPARSNRLAPFFMSPADCLHKMPIYRCVFLDVKAEAKEVEAIDAGNLQHAIELAVEMLNSRPDYLAVEVWRGGQRLYSSKS